MRRFVAGVKVGVHTRLSEPGSNFRSRPNPARMGVHALRIASSLRPEADLATSARLRMMTMCKTRARDHPAKSPPHGGFAFVGRCCASMRTKANCPASRNLPNFARPYIPWLSTHESLGMKPTERDERIAQALRALADAFAPAAVVEPPPPPPPSPPPPPTEPTPDALSPTISIHEFAELLGVSMGTMYNLQRRPEANFPPPLPLAIRNKRWRREVAMRYLVLGPGWDR